VLNDCLYIFFRKIYMPYSETHYIGETMENEILEDQENLSVKDQIVLAAFLASTLVGFGFVARIGWDLAGEAKQALKERKARKTEK
jgi:hypothetical protein